jgi:hypothetical protein
MVESILVHTIPLVLATGLVFANPDRRLRITLPR